MNTFEITKSISKALKASFPDAKIYGEEVKQGLKAPAFTIFAIEPSIEPYPSERYLQVNPFVIHYFPVDQIKTKEECARVADQMIWTLERIPIYNEMDEPPIRGTHMHHKVQDDVLHFFVNYDVFLHRTEVKDKMKILTEIHNAHR